METVGGETRTEISAAAVVVNEFTFAQSYKDQANDRFSSGI
jgi:uncharacterized Ntn-hydrolase superfamily protein